MRRPRTTITSSITELREMCEHSLQHYYFSRTVDRLEDQWDTFVDSVVSQRRRFECLVRNTGDEKTADARAHSSLEKKIPYNAFSTKKKNRNNRVF